MTTRDSFSVAVFGIPDFERQVLDRIFGISSSRTLSYRLAEPGTESAADILLVDRDNAGAVAEYRRVCEAAAPRRPGTVLVARDKPQNHPYHVRRPFMAKRLLGVLDEIVESANGDQGQARTSGTNEEQTEDRYRALVVDDSMAVRKQIGLALERARIAAEFADSGERALALVEDGGYDIVFLDVVMPGLDGYDVCKAIKRDRSKKHIPVVMLTGRSSPFDKVKGKLSGCDTYLTKPVSRDDFVHTLKKYLKEPISLD